MRFGEADATRPPVTIEADEFIAIKSFKAKGKRLTTWNLAEIVDITPEPEPEPKPTPEEMPEAEAETGATETEGEAPAETTVAEPEALVPDEPKQPSLFDDLD